MVRAGGDVTLFAAVRCSRVMPEADDLRKQAAATRELALRARRLAQCLGSNDRDRLLRYAEELEERIARLEAQASARASGHPRIVEQTQQQPQQQQGASDTTDAQSGGKPSN
jgi:hypothetical protein